MSCSGLVLKPFFSISPAYRYLEPSIRVNENLGVTIDSPGELVVRIFCIVNVDLVRNHEAGLCLAGNDQVSQIPVVGLDVALASADGEALLMSEHDCLRTIRIAGYKCLDYLFK